MNGLLFDVKEFALHDGNGLRVTLFLKGCPLSCVWCHNPEGIHPFPEVVRNESKCRHCGACLRPCEHDTCKPYGICLRRCSENLVHLVGVSMTPAQAAARVLESQPFFGKNGGVTFSGGEPLWQASFVRETIGMLEGVNTAVETCGFVIPEEFRKTIPLFNSVFMDMKLFDPELHRHYTGQDNRLILQNMTWLKGQGKPFTVRVPLVPGITDTNDNLTAIADFLKDAKDRVQVELLPYNRLTGAKYSTIGRTYAPPFDENAKMNKNTEPFRTRGISCIAY